MLELFTLPLLWFAAIGSALMAGVYFAFSTFVMASLAKIETSSGIVAMQSINDVILRSAFMPLFFSTTLVAGAAVALALVDDGAKGTLWMLSAGVIYVVGMFATTVVFNVPLNNRLKATDPYSSDGAEVWDLYLNRWSRWNHVRTVASTISSALFFAAI